MKNSKVFFIALVAMLILVFNGCEELFDNKDKDDEPEEITQEQVEAIKESFNEVSSTMDNLLLDGDPLGAFENGLASIQNTENVEDAWIEDAAMIVKFKNGGKVMWYADNDLIIPPYGDKNAVNTDDLMERIPVGDSTALLLNQQSGDENRPYCGRIINSLKTKFEKNNYDVTVKNGADINLAFMANGFAGYGAYFYISHGAYDGSRTWIMTGEEPDRSDFLGRLLDDLYSEWFKDEIAVAGCREKRNGEWEVVKFYMFSDKYVSGMYSGNAFPNSLIYLVACQGMKNTNLASAYVNAGAGVVIGWDETNCLGQSSGKLLFDVMLGGPTVEEAFAAMPGESKKDVCAVDAGANLVYYPSAGKDIVLVEEKEAEIIINTPVAGGTYTERVQTLSGYMSNVVEIEDGVVELNGVPTTLEIQGDTNFSQPLLINNGDNHIKVTCIGVNDRDETVTKTKEITVEGDLQAIDIFTELRWNTPASDVDFHLVPPGYGVGDLWTSNDCYYSNMNTSWGATLDVDDVEGYGPEHITVSSVTEEGEYTLFIHFYDEDGAGTTQGFVSVSVQNGEMQNFGPYTMTNDGGDGSGDVWEVCKFSFPSGEIIPVNQYHNLGKSLSNKKKKKK